MPLFRRLVEDPLGEVDEDGHVGATEWVTPIRVSREYNGRSTSLSKQDPQVPPDKTCASCRNRERAERANVQGVSFHDLHVTLSAKSRVPHTSADIGFVLSSPCAVSTCPFRLSMPASLAGDFVATKISLACKRDKMLTRQPSASVMLGLPRYSHASDGPLPASGIALIARRTFVHPDPLVRTYMSWRIYLARNEQRGCGFAPSSYFRPYSLPHAVVSGRLRGGRVPLRCISQAGITSAPYCLGLLCISRRAPSLSRRSIANTA